MRQKEQKLWDTFARHGQKELDLQRVENIVGVGMPDVYVGESGAWVELKAPTAPKKDSTRLLGNEGLNPDQINWHLKAARTRGTKSFVLIRDDRGRLFLVPGNFAATINELTATELFAYSVATEWDEIIEALEECQNEN